MAKVIKIHMELDQEQFGHSSHLNIGPLLGDPIHMELRRDNNKASRLDINPWHTLSQHQGQFRHDRVDIAE